MKDHGAHCIIISISSIDDSWYPTIELEVLDIYESMPTDIVIDSLDYSNLFMCYCIPLKLIFV